MKGAHHAHMTRPGSILSFALVCAALAVPRAAAAQNGENNGFSFGLGLGSSFGPDHRGVGTALTISPGFEVVDGFDIEVETGFKVTRGTAWERLGFWPVMVGARYTAMIGRIAPFAFAHIGGGFLTERDAGEWYLSETLLALSGGGGAAYAISDALGVGPALSYTYFTPVDGYSVRSYHFVDLTLDLRFGF